MNRADKDLAFILRYENVAWYENGMVRILDRRVYPRIEYVVCKSYVEVAKAITDMVTQSGGPYTAAGMGMVLAAYESRNMKKKERIAFLNKAADIISNARPTTSVKMRQYTDSVLGAILYAEESGQDIIEAAFSRALEDTNNRYLYYMKAGKHLAGKMPKGGTVMTQCWGETIVGMMLRFCREANNEIKVICAETRPYFQGSRLTASCAKDMGFDVTVISDNMPAYVMGQKKVDIFTSASDVITMDGHVVNKIGTFQMAMAAHFWGIPYYVSGTPNKSHPTVSTVKIEERDGDMVLSSLGVKLTMDGVKGYYPAFDITPPRFVSGVVTDKGIYSPYNLESYFDS
jgi:methylthioribose-1-phosphate isomerase